MGAGKKILGQGLLDHAKKISAASLLTALQQPLDEFVATAAQLELLEEEGADPSKPRQQIYPAAFAFQVLRFTVRRLLEGQQMSLGRAVEMFKPRPSSAAGPGIFLASSPRLCDVGGGPSPLDVEKSLGDGFVACYMLDLLARGCEPELWQAASSLLRMLGEWGFWADGLPNWARELANVAHAILFVTDKSFCDDRMVALLRVQAAPHQAAPHGVASMVGQALNAIPWASKAEDALKAGAAQIRLQSKLAALMTGIRIRPEAWEEAAEALPELRERMLCGTTGALESVMWQLLSEQIALFESEGAIADEEQDFAEAHLLLRRLQVGRGLACPEKPSKEQLNAMEAMLHGSVAAARFMVERRRELFRLADDIYPLADCCLADADLIRGDVATLFVAAEKCRGMRLGAEELGPAFGMLSEFAEAAVTTDSLSLGDDISLAVINCALALADVMAPADPGAEVPPALGSAKRRLTQLAGTLKAINAAAVFQSFGPDFEARLAADTNKVFLRRVLFALASMDSISSADGDWELPPVDEARAIAASYWGPVEQRAMEDMCAALATVTSIIEPSWKDEMSDDASWDELEAAGGDFLSGLDTCMMLDAAGLLREAGPAERKSKHTRRCSKLSRHQHCHLLV